MAINEWGHAVLCVVLTVVDDTTLVIKSLVGEIKVGGHHSVMGKVLGGNPMGKHRVG